MTEKSEYIFRRLEAQVDALLAENAQLKQNNEQLQNHVQYWRQERQQLLRKNDLARSKVEALIDRLKRLELSL